MSLVILSNDASESVLIPQRDSIFKPYSFRNSITSTIDIPEDAQVALQSCKITLDGSTAIESGSRVFYVYLGEPVDENGLPGILNVRDSIDETLSSPIRFEMFPDSTGTLDVSQEDIARELSRLLNFAPLKEVQIARRTAGQAPLYGGLYHPNYMTSPSIEISVVDVARDAVTGESEGFDFQIKFIPESEDALNTSSEAIKLASAEHALDACDLDMRFQTDLGGSGANLAKPYILSPALATVVLTPQSYQRKTMGTTFDFGPVSLCDSTTTFNIQNCTNNSRGPDLTTRWMCGLSRVSTTRAISDGGMVGQSEKQLGPRDFWPFSGKEYWAGLNAQKPAVALRSDTFWCKTYFDFGVMVNADGILRVVQYVKGIEEFDVPNPDPIPYRLGDDIPKLVIVDYTAQHGAPPFSTHYDMSVNPADFQNVKFEISGSRVKVSMNGPGGGGIPPGDVMLCEFNANFAPIFEQFKPIDQTAWNLQPIMMINNNLQSASGNAANAYDIRLTQYDTPQGFGPSAAEGPSSQPSYYTYLMERNTGKAIQEYEDLSSRWTNMQLVQLPYYPFDIGTHTFADLFRPVLVVAQSNSYTPTNDANTRKLLGFADMPAEIDRIPPWVADAYVGGAAPRTTQQVISTIPPVAVSAKSIFVRLDNLTLKTMNAANGNPSRIISHLPRFDGQNETGRLFFEPNTLVYVDLNNPAPMKLNSLDVSLVYADESHVTSLVGTTIIVLHIRKKA